MAWRSLVTVTVNGPRAANGTWNVTLHFTNDDGRTVDITDGGFRNDADIQRVAGDKLRAMTLADAVITSGDVLIRF